VSLNPAREKGSGDKTRKGTGNVNTSLVVIFECLVIGREGFPLKGQKQNSLKLWPGWCSSSVALLPLEALSTDSVL
jgi:hypothetical protein